MATRTARIITFIGLALLVPLGLQSKALANIDIIIDPDIPAVFSIDKTLCDTDPLLYSDPSQCPLATQVAAGLPVHYVITVANPWGEPAQAITLQETPPPYFQPSGGPVCRDAATGAVVAQSPAWSLTLDMQQTVHCIWSGTFSGSGSQINIVEASNSTGYSGTAQVNTTVLPSQPSGIDLSVTKTALQASVDVTSGWANISYAIKIRNNSSTVANIGNHFTLHDRMSLRPNSVPLRVEYLNATCVSTSGTDCLDVNNPTVYGPEVLVGTAGQHNFVSFDFAPGQGQIDPGGEISLTIQARVRWIPGLKCYRDPQANGLRNFVYFDLVDPSGSALSESNPSNNSDSADTKVTVSGMRQDDDCALGHIKLTKQQFSPNPSTRVAWGAPVNYTIRVENTSLPAQPITFDVGSITDWVTEGINTPPFRRQHANTSCISSTQPNFCNAFNASVSVDPDADYTYYTQTQRAWASGATVTLQPGRQAMLVTRFRYRDPDCETVPDAPNKPIINTATVRYQATEYGALSASDPKLAFQTSDSAVTNMQDQLPCKFSVTKAATNSGAQQDRAFFGQDITYRVTFASNEPERRIGTLLDRLRFQTSDYAANLPYTSQWLCTDNGRVSDYEATGNITGVLNSTSTPVQGSEGMTLRVASTDGVLFENGGVLTCNVRVQFDRPPLGSNLCMHDPRRIENAAMMDVTHPFNANIHWPPSSTYSAASPSNPPSMKFNWATVSHELPRCMDATLNKSANVDGLPNGSRDWTYEGGPEIDYALTLNNTTRSAISGNQSGGWNGLQIDDRFDAPYATIPTTGDTCSPSGFCQTFPGGSGRRLGVRSLAQNADGVWTFSTPGPFQAGQDIRNCARISEHGSADPGNDLAYQNYATPVGFGDQSAQSDCVTIPVIRTTRIDILKELVDNTGAGITQAGPFDFNVSCSPYDLFLSDNNVSIMAGQIGSIMNVPVRSSCTITESLPPVPDAATDSCAAKGLMAEWKKTITPSTLSTPLSMSPVPVTARNELRCTEGNLTTIRLNKRFRLPGGVKLQDTMTIPVEFSCTPGPVSPNPVILAVPGQGPVSVTVPDGAQCTMTEILPKVWPEAILDYCENQVIRSRNRVVATNLVPYWNDPRYIPGQTFTVTPKMSAGVMNSFRCGIPTKKANQPKGPIGMGTSSGTVIEDDDDSTTTLNGTVLELPDGFRPGILSGEPVDLPEAPRKDDKEGGSATETGNEQTDAEPVPETRPQPRRGRVIRRKPNPRN